MKRLNVRVMRESGKTIEMDFRPSPVLIEGDPSVLLAEDRGRLALGEAIARFEPEGIDLPKDRTAPDPSETTSLRLVVEEPR